MTAAKKPTPEGNRDFTEEQKKALDAALPAAQERVAERFKGVKPPG